MLVSVIIPCFNVEQYVSDCLDSVLKQTYQEFEIICVDNNSSDSTLNLLHCYEAKNPDKITVLQQIVKGAPAARNMGLKAAKGKVIQFLDADDVIAPNKFEKQIKGFSGDVNMVVSDREIRDVTLTKTFKKLFFDEIEQNPLCTSIKRIIITGNPLYQKEFIQSVGGYDEKLSSAQDWDFHLRLVLSNCKIKYVPGIFFISRSVPNSISSNWKKVSVQASEVIKSYKVIIQKSHYYNKEIGEYLTQIYLNSAIYIKDLDRSEEYVKELLYWDSDVKIINGGIKYFLFRAIGIRGLIKLLRLRNKMAGKTFVNNVPKI